MGGGHHAQWVRRAAPLLLCETHECTLVLSQLWDPRFVPLLEPSREKGLEDQKMDSGTFILAFGSKSAEIFKGLEKLLVCSKRN